MDTLRVPRGGLGTVGYAANDHRVVYATVRMVRACCVTRALSIYTGGAREEYVFLFSFRQRSFHAVRERRRFVIKTYRVDLNGWPFRTDETSRKVRRGIRIQRGRTELGGSGFVFVARSNEPALITGKRCVLPRTRVIILDQNRTVFSVKTKSLSPSTFWLKAILRCNIQTLLRSVLTLFVH